MGAVALEAQRASMAQEFNDNSTCAHACRPHLTSFKKMQSLVRGGCQPSVHVTRMSDSRKVCAESGAQKLDMLLCTESNCCCTLVPRFLSSILFLSCFPTSHTS